MVIGPIIRRANGLKWAWIIKPMLKLQKKGGAGEGPPATGNLGSCTITDPLVINMILKFTFF